jgi:hypothetical protein
MDKNTKIILGIVLLGGAYYLYTRKKPEAVGAKNACGQTIPTNVPCFKDLDNNGKCYDSKGNEVDLKKAPEGFFCYNKNGTSRNVNNIAV